MSGLQIQYIIKMGFGTKKGGFACILIMGFEMQRECVCSVSVQVLSPLFHEKQSSPEVSNSPPILLLLGFVLLPL